MAHTLEQFAGECHRILKTEPGPEGRKKVCAVLEDVLMDQEFIAKYVNEDTSSNAAQSPQTQWP